ncbi:MAG TPA: hypothetical protein VLN41_01175, partial [Candidatus Bathyarchaeia archaeon]|nr:hypothetical protein [Candidatus Bathyarchaeia archaeon]
KRVRVAPREKALTTAAVTVLDLRGALGEKKPPKREPGQVMLPRMMMPGSSPSAPRSGLAPAQLGEALRAAGIGPVAPNGYAHFTPGQSYATGKGYLFLSWPAFVFPDHAEFQSGARDLFNGILGGPKVVLRQPGTYTLDFLVEFTASPPEAMITCQSLIGYGFRQIHHIRAVAGPQHIVVVCTVSAEAAGGPDEERSIGINCFQEAGMDKTPWTFYGVEISKN